jgi:hypothetical protein
VTPRLLATLALLLGGGLFLGYLWYANEGPFVSAAGRHLRQLKGRTTAPSSVTPYTFADFAALPHVPPLAEVAALERRGVSLEGYSRWMITSVDGDYHLDMTPVPWPSTPEESSPVTAEITPEWHRHSSHWRWERLAAEFRPHVWGAPPWPKAPRRVRVSGWLLYDFEYDAPYGHPRRPLVPDPQSRRLTGWEIHPVTRIELWDDSLHRFVEYPR